MGALSRWRSRRPTRASEAAQDPYNGQKTMFAAAFPITGDEGRSAWRARSNDVGWQESAWHYYDSVGEVRFAFNWLANAISRAALFAAEEDPETGQVGEPTEDATVQRIASGILGGPRRRPQNLRLMALHWLIAGETFVLVRPSEREDEPDEWVVLPASNIQEQGGRWTYKDPATGVKRDIRPGTDMLIRIWSPHPREQTQSDSSMRAAIPILAEIEKSSQNIAARLDSRLAGNGLLVLPQGMDFPVKEDQAPTASSFVENLVEAASIGIQQPGSAAAQVPNVIQVPDELVSAVQHLDLATEFNASVVELRESAIQRLGRALDMPKEVALSSTAESNHWSAWQVEEMTYKIHIEPLLQALGSAIGSEYLAAILPAAGVRDPERIVLDWDISEVTAAPDRSDDLRDLHDRQLISDDYMRSQFGIPDDAIPSEADRKYQLAVRLVTQAPTTLENPSVAAELGFDPTVPDGGVATPAIESGTESAPEPGPTRSAPERETEPPDGLVAAAELVVFDALSRAGGRLLTREYRGRFGHVDKWELHTVIPVTDTARLMEGSFQFVDRVAEAFSRDPDDLTERLRTYVLHRLRASVPHSTDVLRTYL